MKETNKYKTSYNKNKKRYKNNKQEEKVEEKTTENVVDQEEEPVPKLAPEEQTPEIRTGVVTTDLLNVRTEPKVGDNILGRIVKGIKVKIYTIGGLDSEWLNIKCDLGTGIKARGYVMSKYIKIEE